MYLGRYRQGDWLPLILHCQDGDGEAVVPDEAPTARIYNRSGSLVGSEIKLPPIERYRLDGLFGARIHLGSSFSALGTYHVRFKYTESTDFVVLGAFNLVTGGDVNGAYYGLQHFTTPFSEYIVGQLADGTLEFRRGPSVD